MVRPLKKKDTSCNHAEFTFNDRFLAAKDEESKPWHLTSPYHSTDLSLNLLKNEKPDCKKKKTEKLDKMKKI